MRYQELERQMLTMANMSLIHMMFDTRTTAAAVGMIGRRGEPTRGSTRAIDLAHLVIRSIGIGHAARILATAGTIMEENVVETLTSRTKDFASVADHPTIS